MFDVIIVGGGFAGLSAALPLARARRSVLLVDAGQPRNRFAAASHNLVGHDGRAPAEIRADARRQLAVYPTVAFADGQASAAVRADGGFLVGIGTPGGTRHERGRRLILATGVRDELPAIASLWERWGSTVIHCPYCHGYEVAGRAIGVLGGGAMGAHKAALLPDWGPTTWFTGGDEEGDGALAALLDERGVRIERTPVVALLGEAPDLQSACLADGRIVPLGALLVSPRTQPATPLAAQLGCAFDEGPTGPHVRVDERRRTTVPGVYAAGDVTQPMHSAVLAAAEGVLAGVHAHQSLVFPEAGA
ncbi:thioredoxin reductase [Pseudoduganella lurida]|uniref:Thioredoxin reductase n=1 Tax=Pseudoduganella lurida TaxID=1036180 RepID=A0A562RM44_9BURK|nr:NAD(P)/FAD-dependent oxidoreductase [Pseudoduganella lurida]TWI69684.1 thioredoxin reductase [Pseudoduganella lurida]